jgi:hypothetical protein
MAEESILLGASKVQEHLGPQPQKNPPDFFRRMFHASPSSDTLSLFPWSYEYQDACVLTVKQPRREKTAIKTLLAGRERREGKAQRALEFGHFAGTAARAVNGTREEFSRSMPLLPERRREKKLVVGVAGAIV